MNLVLNEQLPLAILFTILGIMVTAAASVIVAKITTRANRKSSAEANEIADKNSGIEERKANIVELKVIIEELKDGAKIQRDEMRDYRIRLEATERDVIELKSRYYRALEYLRKALAVIAKHNLDHELPLRPDDIDIY